MVPENDSFDLRGWLLVGFGCLLLFLWQRLRGVIDRVRKHDDDLKALAEGLLTTNFAMIAAVPPPFINRPETTTATGPNLRPRTTRG